MSTFPYSSVKIDIIRASDLPIADIKSSDPYVEIYSVGAIKCFLCKTNTIQKNLNPRWDFSVEVPAQRGLRFHLEVYDEDKMGSNDILSYCEFDPDVHHFGQEEPIALTNIITKGVKGTSTLYVRFTPMLKSPPPVNPAPLNAPFYITVDPSRHIWPNTPYTPPGSAQYRLPYDLYLIAVNDESKSYLICSPQNRRIPGATHSGQHPCLACQSLSQAIRVDPDLMITAGFKRLYLAISTLDFTPLCNLFEKAETTIWLSQEEPKKYEKGEKFGFKGLSQHELKPTVRLPCTPSPTANIAVFGSATVTSRGLEFRPESAFFPTQTDPTSAHTPAEIVPNIAQSISKIQGLPITDSFPILATHSLNYIASLEEGAQRITARCINTKKCFPTARIFDRKFTMLCTCSSKESRQLDGAISFSSGSLNIELSLLPNDVDSIYVTIESAGLDALDTEAPGKNILDATKGKVGDIFKKKGGAPSAPGSAGEPVMQLIINDKAKVVDMLMKTTPRHNVLMWFVLIRDVFSGWTIFTANKGMTPPSAQTIPHQFSMLLKSLVNIP